MPVVPVARYSACKIALAQMGTASSGSTRSSSAGCRYSAGISLYSAHSGATERPLPHGNPVQTPSNLLVLLLKKVVLLFYMGSLLGLFALFFAKRSLLGPAEDPGMCGVIKSLENDGAAGVGRGAAAAVLSWHGNVALDARGEAEVRLPAGFLEKVRFGWGRGGAGRQEI